MDPSRKSRYASFIKTRTVEFVPLTSLVMDNILLIPVSSCEMYVIFPEKTNVDGRRADIRTVNFLGFSEQTEHHTTFIPAFYLE